MPKTQVRDQLAGQQGAPSPAACISMVSSRAQSADVKDYCKLKFGVTHQPHSALSSIRWQAGLRIGFGNEQKLTCVSCTFVGTNRNGSASSGVQALVQLFNTTILCQSLTSSADVYTHAAISTPASTCFASRLCAAPMCASR